MMPMTNYDVVNSSNLYNFLFTIFLKLDNAQKKDFIAQMKLLMGLNAVSNFKAYLFRKVAIQELLPYFD